MNICFQKIVIFAPLGASYVSHLFLQTNQDPSDLDQDFDRKNNEEFYFTIRKKKI